MNLKRIWTIVGICLLATLEPAWAQNDKLHKDEPVDPSTVQVRFEVPVNLSQVSPQIRDVYVQCSVTLTLSGHQAPMGSVSIPVVNGAIATTAYVVVRLPRHSQAGETAAYNCQLTGFSKALNGIFSFSENHSQPEFRLSPTPAPLTGTFPWS